MILFPWSYSSDMTINICIWNYMGKNTTHFEHIAFFVFLCLPCTTHINPISNKKTPFIKSLSSIINWFEHKVITVNGSMDCKNYHSCW